jgi:vancomycin resistance protein YoaR
MSLPKIQNKPFGENFKNINLKKLRPFLLVFYGVLLISIAYNVYYARKIVPGVKISGVNIGGLTFNQAKDILQNIEAETDKNLKFKFENNEYFINGEDISLKYDWDYSISKAFEYGRSGNFIKTSWDKLKALVAGEDILAFFDYDEESLGMKMSIIKNSINTDPQESGFHFVNGKIEIIPSSYGRSVEEDVFYQIITDSLDKMNFSEKEIPVKVIEPKLTEDVVRNVEESIKNVVSKELSIKYGEKKWTLSAEDLLGLIEISRNSKNENELILNEYAFKDLSDSISFEVNTPPRGRVVSTEGTRVIEFKIVGEGKELDVEKFKRDLENSLFENREGITVTVNVVGEKGDASKYGIVSLLGEGSSYFKGSANSRIHNIALSAKNTDGVLVAPGEIYSMNNSVGPIDAAHGFQSAYIIKGGRTVLGEGGGVCQTSTTLFRAILNSGLPIVARYPHAYRVGYYEQDMPVGFDAAVFQPSWDFKFKNDTKAYVLVQSYVSTEESKITFKIYGTPDGRVVEISKPVITGQTPPPEPLYEDDPDLKKGVTVQVDFPAWGATSVFTRTVKRGDEVLFTDTFASKYQPWRAVFRVGTKKD